MMTEIRQFALALGASIFTISSTKNKNLTELSKYIIHRTSGLKFKELPELWEWERIIIPSGYDSPDLIKSTGSFSSDSYEKVMVKMDYRAIKEIEI